MLVSIFVIEYKHQPYPLSREGRDVVDSLMYKSARREDDDDDDSDASTGNVFSVSLAASHWLPLT